MSRGLDKDLFIVGNPIPSELGLIRFMTYIEYLSYISEMSALCMNTLHIYNYYKKSADMSNPEVRDYVENIKRNNLFEYVLSDNTYITVYFKIFSLVLDMNEEDILTDSLERIFDSEELFNSMREIVMEMNLLKESPVSDNPEIQDYYDDRMRIKQKESGKQNAGDIISSVVAGTSNSFEDVKKMTVIQFYSIYYRVSAIKSYETATLFATVSEKQEILAWNKHIDLYADDELGIGYDDFNKQYGGLFD